VTNCILKIPKRQLNKNIESAVKGHLKRNGGMYMLKFVSLFITIKCVQ